MTWVLGHFKNNLEVNLLRPHCLITKKIELFPKNSISIVVLLEPTFWKNKIEIMKILSPKFTWLESYSSSDAGWKVLFLHLSSRLLLPPSVTSTASTSTIFTSKARLSSTFAFLPSLSGSKMPLRERQKTKLGYIYGALVQGVSRPKEWTFFPFEIYRSTVGQNWVKKNFFLDHKNFFKGNIFF